MIRTKMLNVTLWCLLLVLAAMPGVWGVKDKDEEKEKGEGRAKRGVRFPNTQKRQLEKSDMSGVFDETNDLSIAMDVAKKNHFNGQNADEDDEDVEELAKKLSYIGVAVETGEQEQYDIDPEDLRHVIQLGKELKGEQSLGNHGSMSECEGEDCEEEDRRRLYIFPPDQRWEVTGDDGFPPLYYPALTTGLLVIEGREHCTGSLIGPKHVLTAAHCLHSGRGGSWYRGFTFYPGKTGQFTPIGRPGVYVWALLDWVQTTNADYDMGIVVLDQEPNWGWTAIGYHNSINSGWRMHTKGYPVDKPFGTMWSNDYDYPWRWNDLDVKFNTMDVVGGQSGSPVYAYNGDRPIIYGNICCGQTSAGVRWNQATRINGARYSLLCDFINDDRVC